jgi:hypothetical protein
MTRSSAVRLVRMALRQSLGKVPAGVSIVCARRARASFSCATSWRQGRDRWGGRVGVWYKLVGSELRWFFNLSAAERSGGARLRRANARGAVRLPAVTAVGGVMLCRVPTNA